MIVKNFKIDIDAGHGFNTAGKRSPDGELREYAYCREIAYMLKERLVAMGYNAEMIVPETYDVKINSTELKEYDKTMGDIPWSGKKYIKSRVARVNDDCAKYGKGNVLLVSIHLNAAGSDGKWHDASGFSVWVSRTSASAKSKRMAQIFTEEAEKMKLMGNRFVPACKYWTADYAIVTKTLCPAVLTENLFQDNRHDKEFLLSPEGKRAIVELHYNAITKYVSEL